MTRLFPLICAATLCGCSSLFYFPDSRVYDRPERLGLDFDTPTFASLDKTRITGIFFSSKLRPAKATVVHFHGNGGNITAQWGFSAWLAERGFNVFVLDYRGYGASEGKPFTKGAVKDGIAALRYVAGRPDVDPGKIVVFGQSLGAAIALSAVAGSTIPVRAVALESPFASFRSIARDKLSYFWLTWPFQWPISWFVSDAYKPERVIRRLAGTPLLIAHGTQDAVVPYAEGLRLYEAAPEPKLLWTVPDGGHVEAFTRLGNEYRPRLVRFFESSLSP